MVVLMLLELIKSPALNMIISGGYRFSGKRTFTQTRSPRSFGTGMTELSTIEGLRRIAGCNRIHVVHWNAVHRTFEAPERPATDL